MENKKLKELEQELKLELARSFNVGNKRKETITVDKNDFNILILEKQIAENKLEMANSILSKAEHCWSYYDENLSVLENFYIKEDDLSDEEHEYIVKLCKIN